MGIIGLDPTKRLGKLLVFDIETYRPTRGVFRDRRIELNPDENYITVIGVCDEKTIEFSPVTPFGRPEHEQEAVKCIAKKISQAETIVGFNILRFDIPYLVHKSVKYGIKFDIQNKRLVDLFWFIPAWLENTDSGHEFSRSYDIGKILSLNKVEKYILNKPMNPISHDLYFKMYEAEEYDKITEKLKVDLLSTYELLNSQQIDDTFSWIESTKIDSQKCVKSCPFRVMQSVTQEMSHGFCPLVSKTVSSPVKFRTVDVIGGQHFPETNVQFTAKCLR